MLEFIDKHYEFYIILGDLNLKHKSFGSKLNNYDGNILDEFF